MKEEVGYVRLFNRTGEAWHIVQCAPTMDAGEALVTHCGRRVDAGIVVSRGEDMRVCRLCDRVRLRAEERAAARQELRWGREEAR